MARQMDTRLSEALKKYGCTKDDLWDCHGTWVIYHAALERAAAVAGIDFDMPHVLEADGDKRCVALCVSARMGERQEWSIGEASPHNYIVKGKMQAYPYAMAEKRGKDRVILKLIGLQGLVYSEEEADDFKPTGAAPAQNEAAKPQHGQMQGPLNITALKAEMRELARELEACTDGDMLNALVTSKQAEIDQCRRDLPEWFFGKPGGDVKGLQDRIEQLTKEFSQKQAAE